MSEIPFSADTTFRWPGDRFYLTEPPTEITWLLPALPPSPTGPTSDPSNHTERSAHARKTLHRIHKITHAFDAPLLRLEGKIAWTVLYAPFSVPDAYETNGYDDIFVRGPMFDAAPVFTMADVEKVFQVARGVYPLDSSILARYNVEASGTSANVVDIQAVVSIARKVAGLEPNP